MRTTLLLLIPMSAASRDRLRDRFELIHAPTAEERATAVLGASAGVEMVLTNGGVGLTSAEVDALPRLRFVGSLGAGFENVWLA